MKSNFFARLNRYFCKLNLITKISNKVKYPRINIPTSVNLEIFGNFTYGSRCGIGTGTNLIIPEQANLVLGDDCYIGRYVELGPSGEIEIGCNTSIQDRCIMLGDIIIGSYCLIAPNVYISSGQHYFDLMPSWLIKDQDNLVARDKALSEAHFKPVIVEDDCWLGINVVVMSGVTIGKGTVVGANSVVTKDIAPYSVVAGAPAKVIKKRLNFVPPKGVVHDNPKDWPYFYSGFEVSQSSIEKYASYGGVATQSEFVLCLDASLGNSIHIIAKNTDSQVLTLIYGDQRKELSNLFQEVVFKINDFSRKTLRFCMQTDSSNVLLIIEKAWVQ